MEQTGKISKEMTIDEILSTFPQKGQKLAAALASVGLECVGCCSASYETLQSGMMGHGMSDEQVNKMVDLLNEILEEKPLDLEKVHLTKSAADKFKEILSEEGKEGWGLRFGDHPGGCGGYEYTLDFSEKPLEDDVVFSCFGVDLHVNKLDLPRLKGSEIDFHNGLRNSGFKISNPNVRSSCGCGSSQSY
jgi:iron-sulfur cluster assembly accessory protein